MLAVGECLALRQAWPGVVEAASARSREGITKRSASNIVNAGRIGALVVPALPARHTSLKTDPRLRSGRDLREPAEWARSA